jgi:DnaJ-class molecular chaperone
VASDTSDTSDSSDTGARGAGEDQGQASHEPRECMACRGTGQEISNLGGAPSQLACPWCEGSGVRTPGIDAQSRWLGQVDGADADAPAAPEPAA